MSQLVSSASRLDEIHARLEELRAAPLPLPEALVDRFMANAPSDLALTARIVRAVVSMKCERGWRDGHTCLTYPPNCVEGRHDCGPCRARRELAAAG